MSGLTDDILHSVLRRVRGSVESIDLPCLLTEDALCLIGKSAANNYKSILIFTCTSVYSDVKM